MMHMAILFEETEVWIAKLALRLENMIQQNSDLMRIYQCLEYQRIIYHTTTETNIQVGCLAKETNKKAYRVLHRLRLDLIAPTNYHNS